MKKHRTTITLFFITFGILLSLTACNEYKNKIIKLPLDMEKEEILGTPFDEFNNLEGTMIPWPNKKYIQNSEFDIVMYRLSVPNDEISYYNIDYTFYENLFIQKEYLFPVLIELDDILLSLTKLYGEPTFQSDKNTAQQKSFFQKLTTISGAQKEAATPVDELLYSFEKEGTIVEILLQDYANFQDQHILRFRYSDETLLLLQKERYAQSISDPNHLQFSELEAFYNGYARGKIGSVWHLVREEDQSLTRFEGYHVYDASYANEGFVILQKIQDPNRFGVRLSVSNLEGTILVDELMSYHRDPKGTQLIADILHQEGDSFYQQQYIITPKLMPDGSLDMAPAVEDPSYSTFDEQDRYLLERYGYRIESMTNDEGSKEEIYDRQGNLVFSLEDESFLNIRLSNGVFITQKSFEDPVYYSFEGKELKNVEELVRIYNPSFKSFERNIFYNESSFPQPEGIDTAYHFTYLKTADRTYLFGPEGSVCSFSKLQEIDLEKTTFHKGEAYFYLKDFENNYFGFVDMKKNHVSDPRED